MLYSILSKFKQEKKLANNNLAISINRAKNLAYALICIIPCVYFVWFFCINKQSLSIDSSSWGTFGDFLGGTLNPIIAMFAFYWLTQSVLIQKTELSETQNILKETEKAQKEQALTQEKKRFEDTLFSLLAQLNTIFLTLNEKQIEQNRSFPSKIGQLHMSVMNTFGDYTLTQRVEIMRSNSSDTSHYFRVLYHLLRFILENSKFNSQPMSFDDAIATKISSTEKFYSNIIRSFINKEVIQLLSINCIATDKTDSFYKYRLLVERYSLLEHLHVEAAWQQELFDQYDPSAFGAHINLPK